MTKWILILSIYTNVNGNTSIIDYEFPEKLKSRHECNRVAMQLRDPSIVNYLCKEVRINEKES